MLRPRDFERLARRAWAIGVLCALCACSVDEFRNAQRMSCDECRSRGGRCITDKFCVLPAGDAAVDAAGPTTDAGSQPDSAMPAPDGGVYERCSEEGKTELCYESEDQRTSLQPPCRAGSRVCHDGRWGSCERQVLPSQEDCNGTDDDCDGRVDEQLDTADCSVPDSEGECSRGTRVCVSGQYKCLQVNHPQSDVCNGKDDDCDGTTDEATELSCYPAANGCEQRSDGSYACRGTCLAGQRKCVDGSYADTCDGSVTPDMIERCTPAEGSAADEDCDGAVDEGCACNDGTSCYTGSPSQSQQQAPCHAGTQACTDATHGTCQGEVTPQPEDCSNEGTDDDCDGIVDNVAISDTSCADDSDAQGACKSGARWRCQGGQQICVDAPAKAEACDGRGIDEDCDGKVDEGFELDSDPDNCGSCGVVCGPGLTCCSGNCVNTASSNTNCSSCGNACASGRTCCSSSCVDTKNDDKNCGGCGRVCNALLSSCNAGSCPLL